MEIIFQGPHNGDEVTESLSMVFRLLKQRFHVERFSEIHLSVTLLDKEGYELELVDSETSTPYRILDVHRQDGEVKTKQERRVLHLVVDNTHR